MCRAGKRLSKCALLGRILGMDFPIEKVRALRAYCKQCASGMKGRPEHADYDNAAKLCEQLVAVMESATPAEPTTPRKKKQEGASNA